MMCKCNSAEKEVRDVTDTLNSELFFDFLVCKNICWKELLRLKSPEFRGWSKVFYLKSRIKILTFWEHDAGQIWMAHITMPKPWYEHLKATLLCESSFCEQPKSRASIFICALNERISVNFSSSKYSAWVRFHSSWHCCYRSIVNSAVNCGD